MQTFTEARAEYEAHIAAQKALGHWTHISDVFACSSEPSPREVLERARAYRRVQLKAAEGILSEMEHRPHDHKAARYSIARHQEAIRQFDAALAALA